MRGGPGGGGPGGGGGNGGPGGGNGGIGGGNGGPGGGPVPPGRGRGRGRGRGAGAGFGYCYNHADHLEIAWRMVHQNINGNAGKNYILCMECRRGKVFEEEMFFEVDEFPAEYHLFQIV